MGIFLVILCSLQTKPDQVATRVTNSPGARALVIPIPAGWKHRSFPERTSAAEFQKAKADRANDLSAKRNLGLILARLQGWNKIAFIDDDITLSGSRSLTRLAGQLDDYHVAGMVVRDYPDNSVVCHARRLALLPQDVFVTGAVLGVHCDNRPLSFFPDIYNEDWFFFAREAAAHKLPHAGHARQAEYQPFASTERARQEEFGDVLAEGLYALIGAEDPSVPIEKQLRTAKSPYWSQFIQARREVLKQIETRLLSLLDHDGDGRMYCALASVAAARNQLEQTVSADLCVNFVDAWRRDLSDWQKFSNCLGNVGSIREAMDFLELDTWTLVKFAAGVVDSETATIDYEPAALAFSPSLMNGEAATVAAKTASDRSTSLTRV
jgi:hypothetical protein